MINREQLSAYMHSPEKLTSEEIPALEELIHLFPYFQTARLLLVAALKNIGDPRLDEYVKKTAIFVADREKLQELAEEYAPQPTPPPDEFEFIEESPKPKAEERKPAGKPEKQAIAAEPETKEEAGIPESNIIESQAEETVFELLEDKKPAPAPEEEKKKRSAFLPKLIEQPEIQITRERSTITAPQAEAEEPPPEDEHPADKLMRQIKQMKAERQKRFEAQQKVRKTLNRIASEKSPEKEEKTATGSKKTESPAEHPETKETESKPADKLRSRLSNTLERTRDESGEQTGKLILRRATGRTDEEKTKTPKTSPAETPQTSGYSLDQITNDQDKGQNTGHDDNSFAGWLEKLNRKKEKEEIQAEEKKTENKMDIIDRFLEINPRIEAKEADGPNEDISEASTLENDNLFTETLAKIYLKQGNYQKALTAYKKLSLKFPEKNTYFAGRIKMIEDKLNA